MRLIKPLLQEGGDSISWPAGASGLKERPPTPPAPENKKSWKEKEYGQNALKKKGCKQKSILSSKGREGADSLSPIP